MNNNKSHTKGTWKVPLINSTRFRITFGIILILSSILFISGYITLSEQRDRMLSQMQSYGEETVDFVAKISAVPIQKFSYYQLENYVAQLEKGQLIAYCEIYDRSGDPLAHTVRGKNNLEVVKDEDMLEFVSPVLLEDEIIGTVKLGVDLAPALAKIRRTSYFIMLAFCLELIIIAAAVSFFVNRSLVSPILQLTETTQDISVDHFSVSSLSARKDEVGMLAQEINTMSVRLEDSYRTLERKVDERTAALTNAKNASEQTAKDLEVVTERLQVLLDNSPVGILFISSDRIIQNINQEFSRIFGYDSHEVIGQSSRLLYNSDEDYEAVGKAAYSTLQSDGFSQLTLRMIKKDGREITCALRGRNVAMLEGDVGVIWSVEDISFRLKMEEELLKVKKMESIGILAGGIAHDFNNILAAIIGNVSLAERMIDGQEKVNTLLSNAKTASLRAKDLTFKLLTFAKGGDPVLSVEHLPETVKESVSFVLAGSNVRCEYDFAEGIWPIPIDKGQINQVIQNLILNADQSMPDGGTITIVCRNEDVQKGQVRSLEPGRYVRLDINDTGEGIAEDHLDNIFDPYFSTKEKSTEKGSGLGLSIVHSIVTKHGGTISVRSTVGEGTVFTMYFPAASEDASQLEKNEFENGLQLGKGKVLVMDDEETIQVISREMLEYLGYEVSAAMDGAEAIEIYSQKLKDGSPIDIVIMDLTIPGAMGGKEAVRHILKIDQDARVIVSSGYSDDPVIQNFQEYGFTATISKPYQLTELSEILVKTMESS